MMKTKLVMGLLLSGGLSAAASVVHAVPQIVDLSNTAIPSGTITDGTHAVTFEWDQLQPSGTGVLNPFLRLQHPNANRQNEQGYNTSAGGSNPALPFDDQPPAGGFTRDLLFSELEQSAGVYSFVLDIGEPVGRPGSNESLLSLDGLKLFKATTGNQTDETVDGNGDWDWTATGFNTLLWDMDALDYGNYVLLDANRGGNPGNGVSDALITVPAGVFAGVNPTDNIILWARFGLQEGATAGSQASGTFEEIAHLTGISVPPQQIPEPGILALLGTGLLGATLVGRRRRKNT